MAKSGEWLKMRLQAIACVRPDAKYMFWIFYIIILVKFHYISYFLDTFSF